MNTGVEDLIQQAQQQMADRAADPDRIRAALATRVARRTRTRRTGLLVAVTAAVATTAAVVVPMTTFRTAATDPPAEQQPAAAPAAVEIDPVALGFRPTRLPSGLGEHGRLIVLTDGKNPGLHRLWSPPGKTGDEGEGSRLELDERRTSKPLITTSGTPVDINGRPGVHHGAAGKSYLEWRLDGTTVLTLSEHGLDLSREEMTGIARSVRPEPGTFSVPVRLGVLPDIIKAETAEVTGTSPDSWSITISGSEQPPVPDAGRKERPRIAFLSVAYATTADVPAGARPVTVAGRPAHLFVPAGGEKTGLIVDLGGGRWLDLAASGVTEAELIGVAEAVQVDDAPDLGWLGTR